MISRQGDDAGSLDPSTWKLWACSYHMVSTYHNHMNGLHRNLPKLNLWHFSFSLMFMKSRIIKFQFNSPVFISSTHCGLMTPYGIKDLVNIIANNGLLPVRSPAITGTEVDVLSTETSGTNISAHLYSSLVCLCLDGVWLPDSIVFHVNNGATLAIHAKTALLTSCMLGLKLHEIYQYTVPMLWKTAPVLMYYRKTSNIRHTLVGNTIVDHSDVVGTSPVDAAPTTSSFSTWHLASGVPERQYENLLSLEI